MYNPFSLINKNLLITGASSGIGRSIAIECSKAGANLIITGRDIYRLNETLQQLEFPERHSLVIADLSIEENLKQLVDGINIHLNGIVHSAGFTEPRPFQTFTASHLHSLMTVNFEAPIVLTQNLLKEKKIVKNASIVFISSISGVYVSFPGGSLYSASKGAINGIVKAMAIELATKNIRVNCINPGLIDTKIYSEGIISKEQITEELKRYPLKRLGKPEEVAYAAIYFLSEASAWTTGANLLIDGGFTLL